LLVHTGMCFYYFKGARGVWTTDYKKPSSIQKKNVVMRIYKLGTEIVKLVMYFKVIKILSQGAEHNIIVIVQESMLFIQCSSYSTTTKGIILLRDLKSHFFQLLSQKHFFHTCQRNSCLSDVTLE